MQVTLERQVIADQCGPMLSSSVETIIKGKVNR